MEQLAMIKNMEIKSSKNYDFHYFKDSIAERDIDKISELQEDCFEEICETLKINPEIRIQYFLVDNPELVGVIYGDNEACNGFAEAPNKIYAVYNEKIKCIGHHEDAHILSYPINRPSSVFIREGLAMYFDEVWWDKSNETWVREFLIENKYIKITELLNNDTFFSYQDLITYPIAGAFTKFIIEKYGIDKYLDLYKYRGKKIIDEFENIYFKSVNEIEIDFNLLINKIK